MAVSYLTPLFGGFLADRVFGHRAALLIGTAVLLAGYIVLSFDLPSLVYVALALLVLGQGLFRPSIVAALGRIYDPAPAQRDDGFSRFYIAVNVGSALGPLVGSAGRAAGGWPGAFVLAAVTAAVCLLTLAGGLFGYPLEDAPQAERASSRVALHRLRPVGLLLLGLVIYFAAYMQTTSTVLLFARDKTQRDLWGYEVPVGVIAALPAIIVVVLSPLLTLLSNFFPARRELRATHKMICGLLFSALAFLVLAGTAQFASPKMPLGMLSLSIVLLTVGELLVIPMGQSLLSELAPASLKALTTGLWYGALAAGVWLGGLMGVLYERWTAAAFFAGCAGLVLGAAVMMRLLANKLPSD